MVGGVRRQEQAREALNKARRPLRDALTFVAGREHRLLREKTLQLENLCGSDGTPNEDGLELAALVKRIRQFGFGLVAGAEPLSDEEQRRYEQLIGVAAGNEQVFENAREEAASRAKAREMAEGLKVSMLERRPQLEEAGSVTLPRYAAFSWLKDDREAAWTLADVAALAALLASFENRDASLIANASFEVIDGEPVIVIAGGVGADLRFAGQIGGDSVDPNLSGCVRLRSALVTLAANRWFVVGRAVTETTIRLGPRALKCRAGA